MANTTSKHALNIHGTNPQFLIEKIIRSRIYDSVYWKEQCFALTSASLIDKAIALNHIGGTFEAQKITPFLCLLCKLLQIQPEKEILLEYLKFDEFKYLRALAAMYVRMTFKSIEVYEVLEPMLNDYRKLRYKGIDGSFSLLHMDEFIDQLLTQDRVCEITLPRLTKREVLEETENLGERISSLEEVLLGEMDLKGGGKEKNKDENRRKRKRKRNREEDASQSESASGNESESAGSNDSFLMEIREKKRRNERIRQEKSELESGNGMDLDSDSAGNGQDPDELEGYTSQEYSDQEEGEGGGENQRFISQSPERSVSPDRLQSQNGRERGEKEEEPGEQEGQEEEEEEESARTRERERFISKSPSRSRSRSRSRSLSPSGSVSPDRSKLGHEGDGSGNGNHDQEQERFISKSPSTSP